MDKDLPADKTGKNMKGIVSMKEFKQFLKAFWMEEDGIEILEVIAIIAASCIVISVIMALYGVMSDKIREVQGQVEGLDMTF